MAMPSNYGVLINPNTKLHRSYFNEMVRLLGVNTKYRIPIFGEYTQHGEYRANSYTDPIIVGCIFQDKLDQKTSKKLGWDHNLLETAAVIHVPYDLEGLQVGCTFEIPSAYDNTKSRLFRVTNLSATMIYPASISCEIIPEYETKVEENSITDFSHSNFNLLRDGD